VTNHEQPGHGKLEPAAVLAEPVEALVHDHTVVEAAGGQVVRLTDGQALSYNSKADILNPEFLAYGDPACYRNWPKA